MSAIVLNRTSLCEQIYEAIRDKIVYGEFKSGQRLNVDQLARTSDVSVTPVREALARLAAERLVVFEPNKGYRVTAPPDPGWFSDLFDVRNLIEPYAASIGAVRRDERILLNLLDLQRQISELSLDDVSSHQKFVRLNKDLHTLIVESAGNSALLEQYKTLSYHAQVALLYTRGMHDVPEVSREHVPILEAFRRQDARAAEESMRAHILGGKRRALGFMSETQEPGPSQP